MPLHPRCLTPDRFAESPRPARGAILGSTAGVRAMELGGLEPPTSWVRSIIDWLEVGAPDDDLAR